MKQLLLVFFAAIILTGCATNNGYQGQADVNLHVTSKAASLPKNPKHGDKIWGPLTVGMSIKDVLATLPKSTFDDQWSSGGMVAVMAEAGISANNKVKVTAEIKGPFNSTSTLYALFDEADRLDGVVIATKKNELPAEIVANYGALGYYLVEYKDAAKQIIRYGMPELGKRIGAPKFGKEQLDSIGSMGVATGIGKNNAIGFGWSMGSISPASIVQVYQRDGYRSMLSIRTVYLGTYNVYGGLIVFMALQAKAANVDEIPDIE